MKKLVSGGLLLAVLMAVPAPAAEEREKWTGIDEGVIEKYATERGRSPAEPFINVEGDLLLFLFALAGAAGGFVMGFYWHKVFVAGRRDGDSDS